MVSGGILIGRMYAEVACRVANSVFCRYYLTECARMSLQGMRAERYLSHIEVSIKCSAQPRREARQIPQINENQGGGSKE